MVTVFGATVLPLVERESISGLLTQGRKSKSRKGRQHAAWVLKEFRRLRQHATAAANPQLANALQQPLATIAPLPLALPLALAPAAQVLAPPGGTPSSA